MALSGESGESRLSRAVPPDTCVSGTRAGGKRSPVDNPWVVLTCLFLATGALGIPLLWVSRAFRTPAKVMLSVVVTLYTAFILWLFWLVMMWCYHRVTASL
jgi:hypothetical protein